MMHPSTYEYLKPTDDQMQRMARVRAAAKARNEALVDQLEKRVAERNTSPFLSKEKREAEAGASFVNLNGNDFTAKYGAYMPTE